MTKVTYEVGRASFSVKIDADGGKINDAGYEEIASYKYDTGKIRLPSDVTKEGYVFAEFFRNLRLQVFRALKLPQDRKPLDSIESKGNSRDRN